MATSTVDASCNRSFRLRADVGACLACARVHARSTGPQIDPPGILRMHGTAGRAAHLARALMMVALLPRGLIGGLGEDPDAVSYPESKHAST